MPDRIFKSEHEIRERISSLGKQLNDYYVDQFKKDGLDPEAMPLVVVSILKGSFVFFSDLIRSMEIPLVCDFFALTRFQDKTTQSDEVKITLDLSMPVQDRHVLVIDDIVDSAHTINYLYRNLKARNPKSVQLCCLLSKPARKVADITIDFAAFEIEDERYVYGYGIDRKGLDRGLPSLSVSPTRL